MARKRKKPRAGLAGMGNDALHHAMQEKRRSNAAQPHLDSRTQRARTRADATRKAITDSRRSLEGHGCQRHRRR
ncbi:hypothetical protein [Demequina globuliformis]|uniref:hypothetical protein n=1 Tax=Demequina globuliformis TaxID=676202 RepID=UPI000782A06F|nr:hypothetical protein [Demequina globuliformis]